MTIPADAPAVDASALKPLNTRKEIAEFFGRGVDYVKALNKSGKLGYYKDGDKQQTTVRIGREHVAEYLRRCER